jgi:hypothetical protein
VRNEYRDGFKTVQREYYWSVPRILVAGAVALLLSGLILRPIIFASKIFEPSSVITNYERFHDLRQQFESRKAQIASFKSLSPDANVRIDLMAIQQSCRSIVSQYNADSTKINKGLFRGASLPETLNMDHCH